ncbi:MAG: SHD1 domain-containing protein [Pirellulaceae bacterium]
MSNSPIVFRSFRGIAALRFAPLLLGLLLSLVFSISVAEGARFKKGDAVEVFYFSKWCDGVVLDINKRGGVLVSFTYGISRVQQKQTFKEEAVRYPFEADALGKGRTWADPTGNFRITAAALRVVKEQVTLRKEDMTTIDVPLNKLSDNDQQYLERLKRQLGPVAAGVPEHPPLEQFAGSGAFQGGYAVSFMERETDRSLPPDPIPEYLKLREGGATFTTDDQSYSNNLGVILPVGGPDSWLLASVEQRFGSNKELPTRLVWASIARKKMETYQLLPPGESVLDYHPPSNLLLTFNREDKKPGEKYVSAINLTLWKTLPTQQYVEPVLRWNADGQRPAPSQPWARIIDGDIVLQLRDDQEYVGWNIQEKRVEYIVQQESVQVRLPELSGGRKYVFLPEQSQVRVFDSRTGEIITALPAREGAYGLAVNDACTKLAVWDASKLRTWDLLDLKKEPGEYQAEALGRSNRARMSWLGDDRLMVSENAITRLFSLSQKMVIWTYKYNFNTVREDYDTRLRHVINDHLVYGATIRDGSTHGFAVGNVRLPGPSVDEVTSRAGELDTTIIEPGDKVRLEVRCGDQFNHEVYTALVEKIQTNGWILTQNEPTETVMYADMTTGASQSVTYVSQDAGYSETVTVVPQMSSLVIKVGDQTVWESQTRSGVPDRMNLTPDITVQQHIDLFQTPNAQFFRYSKIPSSIADPQYKDGLGITDVTTRGLEVK